MLHYLIVHPAKGYYRLGGTFETKVEGAAPFTALSESGQAECVKLAAIKAGVEKSELVVEYFDVPGFPEPKDVTSKFYNQRVPSEDVYVTHGGNLAMKTQAMKDQQKASEDKLKKSRKKEWKKGDTTKAGCEVLDVKHNPDGGPHSTVLVLKCQETGKPFECYTQDAFQVKYHPEVRVAMNRRDRAIRDGKDPNAKAEKKAPASKDKGAAPENKGKGKAPSKKAKPKTKAKAK